MKDLSSATVDVHELVDFKTITKEDYVIALSKSKKKDRWEEKKKKFDRERFNMLLTKGKTNNQKCKGRNLNNIRCFICIRPCYARE